MVNGCQRIFEHGHRFHEEMKSLTNRKIPPQKSVHPHYRPQPGRMLVEIILEDAGNAAQRLQIAGTLFEAHLFKSVFQDSFTQRSREF